MGAGADLRRELASVVHRGLALPELFGAAERALRRAVSFDGCCWLTLDPATYLPTSHVAHGSLPPEAVPRLARNEIVEDDVNKLADLARTRSRAGILSEATGGRPERSTRYRDLLRPNGFEAELRGAFVHGTAAWGGMAMYRRRGRPDFVSADRAALTGASRLIAIGIRRALLLAAVEDRADELGLILLEPGGAVEVITPAARQLLDQLIAPAAAEGQLPTAVTSVAYRALLAARGGRDDVARARVPTRDGRWLVIHGSAIGDAGVGRTAVIVEPARAVEIAPLIVAAYGLTPREQEITGLVLQGRSTSEIAKALNVSAYTVQDHLKSIFEKVGARSRRELVAQVFFTHYAPPMSEGARIDANGWFSAPGR